MLAFAYVSDTASTIAYQGVIPWRLRTDRKHLREKIVPQYDCIIVGSRTLPEVARANYDKTIVKFSREHSKTGLAYMVALVEARNCLCLGGAETFRALSHLVTRVHLSTVHGPSLDGLCYEDDWFEFGVWEPTEVLLFPRSEHDERVVVCATFEKLQGSPWQR